MIGKSKITFDFPGARIRALRNVDSITTRYNLGDYVCFKKDFKEMSEKPRVWWVAGFDINIRLMKNALGECNYGHDIKYILSSAYPVKDVSMVSVDELIKKEDVNWTRVDKIVNTNKMLIESNIKRLPYKNLFMIWYCFFCFVAIPGIFIYKIFPRAWKYYIVIAPLILVCCCVRELILFKKLLKR